ncbi:MAG: sugar ABC transporter substrate-binding protein [Actinomycetia bacterium]|nr:sugar ABC transporter substrate-binding protein [Actinomycetes bacterium]
MKILKLLAISFAFMLVLAACGSDSDDDDSDDSSSSDTEEGSDDAESVEQTQSGDLTFHMITHSDDGPFWSVVKRGAEAAAADVGVTLVWNPGNNDPQQMVQDIDAAIAAGTNGIAASLPDPDALTGPLQRAVEAGIPVYTLNSGVDFYKEIGATSHIGQTEVVAGNGAGERFNAAGATHVLCIFQEEANVGLTERCNGLEETFSGEVTVAFGGLDADQTDQENTINAILSEDESIDAVLGVGPVIAMSALRASDAVGRDAIIGGFDITPEIIEAIEAGDVSFTVDQQQYLQGYLPVILMYLENTNQNTAGGGLPILTGPGFVTPDNAAQVKALVDAGTR